LATDSDITSVANAIRVKAEISGTLEFPDGFISAINSISGGGASNVVFGTFAGNTDGEKLAISTNYSGSGYPVALLIYSSGGVSSQAGVFYLKIKRDTTVPPKYVLFSDEDYGLLSFRKPSKTNTSFAVFMFYASGPSGTDNLGAVFTDNTTLGVCISNSNNLFVTGQTYSYVIAYSE
jgi:hypothetical protein